MEKIYEGYWYRSHKDPDFEWQYGLYKENKYHPNNVYDDDDAEESHVDDRIADKENVQLLGQGDIAMGLQNFLEVGMKYKVTVEVRDKKYLLNIVTI